MIGDEWKANGKSFKFPERIGNQAVLSYHQQSLIDSIKAQTLPATERRYRSLLLSLNEEDFAHFTEEFNVFIKDMLSRYDVDTFNGRKLFQVNFNLHSVSN